MTIAQTTWQELKAFDSRYGHLPESELEKVKDLSKEAKVAFYAGLSIGLNTPFTYPDPRGLPKPKPKTGEFVCKCCGELFVTEWVTRRPHYKNAAHRNRAYRLRKAKKEGREYIPRPGGRYD